VRMTAVSHDDRWVSLSLPRAKAHLGLRAHPEPSLMIPGIIISLIFSGITSKPRYLSWVIALDGTVRLPARCS
jgi:hypothetical protein